MDSRKYLASRSGQRRPPTRGLVLVLIGLLAILVATGIPAGGNQEESSTRVDHADEHRDIHEHTEIGAVDLAEGERLRVVATTSIVGDVVTNVAGEAAEVTVLIPIGQNPHAWEPTPSAMAAIETADIVFVNGLDLEEALMKAIDQRDSGFVVEVSHGVEILSGASDDDGHDHGSHDDDGDHDGHDHDDHGDGHDDHVHEEGDPHTWFSPLNVMVWVENIEEALSSADPGRAEQFASNAGAYLGALEALDDEMRTLFEPIPLDERKLVIDHAALGYFARDYDFQILGAVIPSTTDQAEPSAQAMVQLIRTIQSENIPAIFVGGTASQGLQDLVATVAQEVEREISIHTLLTGSLTPSGTPGDTYLGFTRYNAGEIAKGLTE